MVVYRDPSNGHYVERCSEGPLLDRQWVYKVYYRDRRGRRVLVGRFEDLPTAVSICHAKVAVTSEVLN